MRPSLIALSGLSLVLSSPAWAGEASRVSCPPGPAWRVYPCDAADAMMAGEIAGGAGS